VFGIPARMNEAVQFGNGRTTEVLLFEEGRMFRPPAEDESRSSDVLKSSFATQFYLDNIVDISARQANFHFDKGFEKPKWNSKNTENFESSVTDQIVNSSAAYLKCFDTIDNDAVDGQLDPELYVSFVNDMVGNNKSTDLFRNLPNIFVLIFYSTVCTSKITAKKCEVGATPIINTTEVDDRIVLCTQMLKTVTTETVTSFRYTIRYNTSRISNDDLSRCLEDATDNLLFDELAGCKPKSESNPSNRRILVDRKTMGASDENKLAIANHTQFPQENSRGSLSYHSQCRYLIHTKVDAIVQLRKSRKTSKSMGFSFLSHQSNR
jgi:hypothetical protein